MTACLLVCEIDEGVRAAAAPSGPSSSTAKPSGVVSVRNCAGCPQNSGALLRFRSRVSRPGQPLNLRISARARVMSGPWTTRPGYPSTRVAYGQS